MRKKTQQSQSRVERQMSTSTGAKGDSTQERGNSRERQSQVDGNDGGAMAARFSQKISILVFRGHPKDSVDTRVAKLHLDFQESENRDITFEMGPGPYPVLQELTNQGPPSQRPHFLRKIDVATVPVASELDMALRDTIRSIPPNPEWDDRNWVDDVLRVLQAAWPLQINNGDVTYALNFMVDVLYLGY
ncbi:hypothetical protein DL766_002092 [Monosporascus sp. MC13-8B]|uniref:Uncharacterized protein n=1 Tax=Monosporascus cannonballus TaxID=155416 RepID=A0ABY0GX09_9PEZI|nr:hypothetical protein DL762_008250 [Monosporascus cannonballus]RYO81689.1 hypothetical protein DL763_008503 [Monosporascus cannonballus]RYP36205.1 hypothetical protein DL766_002092 [Monosporascus sp. MC13-8B]